VTGIQLENPKIPFFTAVFPNRLTAVSHRLRTTALQGQSAKELMIAKQRKGKSPKEIPNITTR
jgi:hypothetical protein